MPQSYLPKVTQLIRVTDLQASVLPTHHHPFTDNNGQLVTCNPPPAQGWLLLKDTHPHSHLSGPP